MNGRKSTLLLLTAGALAAGLVLAWSILYGKKESGGPSGRCRILSYAELEELRGQKEEAPFSAECLSWLDGAPACEEEAAVVYLPCSLSYFDAESEGEASMTSRWEDLLSNLAPAKEGGVLYAARDERMMDPALAMREGYPFQALLTSGNGAVSFQIVLTGLPALCIEKTDALKIRAKEEHEGRIRLIDCLSPDADAAGRAKDATVTGSREEKSAADSLDRAGWTAAESRASGELLSCLFHVRGNVSSGFAKKPYKISLTGGAGEKKKVSWLGLREDDDWILNPLYTDETRVREMTAYALWEKTQAFSDHPQSSSRMRYVELFMDGQYQGIYGLMEPVDKKQLGLTEGDLLYKIDRWDWEYPYADLYGEMELAKETEIKNQKGYNCVEIRWPLSFDATATWKPMEAFHLFSFSKGAGEEKSAALKEKGLSADLDSIVSLSLFCGLAHAVDNNWKNTFLIAKKEPQGYSLYRTVWDLNYVFGDVFVFKPEEGYTAFDARAASSWTPGKDSTFDYEAFLEADPSLGDVMAEKWAKWRQGGISAQSLIGLAQQYRGLLREAGALKREAARWPFANARPEGREKDAEFGQEAQERMEEWIRERFSFLDGCFGFSP